MSPSGVRSMNDSEIVDMLLSLRPGDESLAWLASVISSPVMVEGVNELQRRYSASMPMVPATTASGRQRLATRVAIDPERFRSFFWMRRMPLCEVGPAMDPPRSDTWANAVANKMHAGYYALDDLACALGMHVDQLIYEVGDDSERSRLSSSFKP